ncbi:MAG: hypothetical protein IKU36_02120 [Bacteroidales bacterium]|nr:hypothetical protein [Bacteroidales bacterium]
MERMLATALIISLLFHIVFAIDRFAERKKWKLIKNLWPSQQLLSLQENLPTADDAQFLRKQIRNPSWEKIYKGINKAIQNGESSFEFHFHSDPKIPFNEIAEELGDLGYTVCRLYPSLSNDNDFVVKWG